ncbi:MAG: hypothetical protein WDZ60_05860, partial [Wenzhouxiangellaceae bacterium]
HQRECSVLDRLDEFNVIQHAYDSASHHNFPFAEASGPQFISVPAGCLGQKRLDDTGFNCFKRLDLV